MGSGSSKEAARPSSSSSGGGGGGWRLRSRWAFSSSCFGPPSTLGDHQTEEENGSLQSNSRTDEAACKVNQRNHESSGMFGVPQVSKFSSWTSSDTANHGESQEGTSRTGAGASSRTPNMQSTVGQSSSHPSCSHPCFGLISDAIGLRLNRAVSLGSSGAHSFFSGSASVSNSDGIDHVHVGRDSSMNNTNETQENITMDAVSSHGMVGNNANFGAASSECSRRNCSEVENFARRHPSRLRHQELLEGSIRFSRTLSVGRLRDRVLRRASYTDGLLGSMLLEDQFTGYTGQGNGRRALSHISRTSSSNRVVELTDSPRNSISQIISSMDSSRDYDSESSQYREYTNRDLLVHRSAFLERRRRIRSQVRALQQLGSRFENLSRHDRSCILSGQHRTGRCTCRTNSRTTIPDEDTSTRGSISRIVMLAEALFEVLDEIHQQSVVLSSQPSFSSIGSVPAPKEVVECMPVKVYVKPQRHQNEEALQCYICLVEYEEGDLIRMLPCHHEFHQICIDKWLKEIHRVCPLCRGDVCISESASVEKV